MLNPTDNNVKISRLPSPQSPEEYGLFCSIKQLSKILGPSTSTLYEWAAAGKFVAGTHYFNVGRTRLWNIALCADRLVHWDDDQRHQKAIDNFARTLPSGWQFKPERDSA